MFHVIYLLDSDGEATGTTYRFCSVTCRSRFRADPRNSQDIEEPTADSEEDYCNDSEICCECGTLLLE